MYMRVIGPTQQMESTLKQFIDSFTITDTGTGYNTLGL